MGLIANQIPLCYPPSTATAVLLAQPSQQESSVTPKDKSFLQLHWLEQPVSLDIAGAAPDDVQHHTARLCKGCVGTASLGNLHCCRGLRKRSLIVEKPPCCSQTGFQEQLFSKLVPFEQELVAAGAQQPWCDFDWGSLMPVKGAALEHQPSWGKCLPSAGLFQSC